jgi:hypothetical protein
MYQEQNYKIISTILWSANQLIDLGVCPYDINNPQRKFGKKINNDVHLNGSFMIPDDNKKFTFHDNDDAHWIEISNRPFENSYDYDSDYEKYSDYPNIYRTKIDIHSDLIPITFKDTISLLIKMPMSICVKRGGELNVQNSYGSHIEIIISNYGINKTTGKKFFLMETANFYSISDDYNFQNVVLGDRQW